MDRFEKMMAMMAMGDDNKQLPGNPQPQSQRCTLLVYTNTVTWLSSRVPELLSQSQRGNTAVIRGQYTVDTRFTMPINHHRGPMRCDAMNSFLIANTPYYYCYYQLRHAGDARRQQETGTPRGVLSLSEQKDSDLCGTYLCYKDIAGINHLIGRTNAIHL